MRKSWLLIASLFVLYFSLAIANAQVERGEEYKTAGALVTPVDTLGQALRYFFVIPRDFPVYWPEFIVMIVVFIMLAVAFSDIIYGFTAFSSVTSKILGFGLAVIAALTTGVFWIARALLAITAFAGVLSVTFAIFIGFFGFFIVHLVLGKIFWKMRAIKDEKELAEKISTLRAGIRAMKEAGKEVKG